jgi:hypothetical protein
MTDYFKGLLQRSMGLTPVVQPLVRPQFAAEVASAGLSITDARRPGTPEHSEELPAGAHQPMVPAEPFQTMTGLASGSEGPTRGGGPAKARDTNSALPTPENQPGLEPPVSQPPAIHSPRLSQKRGTASDGRSVTRRPAVRSAEPAGERESLDISVSRLVTGRTTLRKGPAKSRNPAQAGGLPGMEQSSMPEGVHGAETAIPVQPLIHSDAPPYHDAARPPGQDRDESTPRGDDVGQGARHTARTLLSFKKRSASSLPYHDRSELHKAAGESAIELTSAGIVPIPGGSHPEYPADQQAPRVPSTRARERLVYSEPPLPSIEVTIGRVEVRAILPPSPAPQTPAPRKSPILPLDEYLKARNEGKR